MIFRFFLISFFILIPLSALSSAPTENSRFSIAGLALGISPTKLQSSGITFLSELGRRTQVDPDPREGWSWTDNKLSNTRPFIWLIVGPSAAITPDLVVRLQRFMAMGGTILAESSTAPLARSLLQKLREELFRDKKHYALKKNDLLTRTFYILPPEISSRFRLISAFDRVVWIESQKPLLKLMSGSAHSRELAIRAGINIVIYTLTGSYKDDLTHVNYLMRRKKK